MAPEDNDEQRLFITSTQTGKCRSLMSIATEITFHVVTKNTVKQLKNT